MWRALSPSPQKTRVKLPLPPKPQTVEGVNTMGSEQQLCFSFECFMFLKTKRKTSLGQDKAYLKEGFVESLRYVEVCTALCNDT